jgi:hypothetical protein
MRWTQELMRDVFVIEDREGRLSLASEITAINWERVAAATVIGPDGQRRVERRPQA